MTFSELFKSIFSQQIGNNRIKGKKILWMIDLNEQYQVMSDGPPFLYLCVPGVSTLVQIQADPLFLRELRETLSSTPMDTHHDILGLPIREETR